MYMQDANQYPDIDIENEEEYGFYIEGQMSLFIRSI